MFLRLPIIMVVNAELCRVHNKVANIRMNPNTQDNKKWVRKAMLIFFIFNVPSLFSICCNTTVALRLFKSLLLSIFVEGKQNKRRQTFYVIV